MAKQPSTTRPWTRLASLRPASPPPTPSPKAQPSSSLSHSPSLKASHAPKISTIDDDNNNNAYANSTMQPQNHKNITTQSPSPSPLKAKTEAEHKIIAQSEPKMLLVQKESGENKKQLIAHDETKDKGNIPKKNSPNSEDSALGIRAITLAGENRGAYMEIIQSSQKPNSHHKKGNSKINKVHDYESEGNVNGNSKNKNNHHKERTKLYSPPFGAYINSNVQSANNSLLYYTSCKSNDPGVQITLSRKPYSENEEFHLKDNVKARQNN